MQKPLLAGVTGLSIIAIVGLALALAPQRPLPDHSKPRVAATIFPLADIARHVAGNSVEVVQLLPPGASPHTFEPRPSDLRAASGAAVLYEIGHGLDAWAGDIAEAAGLPTVTVDKGIALRPSPDVIRDEEDEHEEHEGEEHEGPIDPHYWLDLKNSQAIAQTIADDLSERFPPLADEFSRNADAYRAELAEADRGIRDTLSAVKNRRMVTLHDGWHYFAAAYGLDIVGTFEPAAGREPTPRYLAALRDAVRRSGVRTLYAEPGLSSAGIESFAADSGLRIARINPEGFDEPGDTFITVMLHNARTIRENQ